YIADWESGIKVINISNPRRPYEVTGYGYYGYAHDLYTKGKYAYIANGSQGFQVIDISNPANPAWVTTLELPGDSKGFMMQESLAYVAAGDAGLHIVDYSDPYKPVRIGGYDTPGIADKVVVEEKFAYVADGEAGVQIMDVSESVKPKLVATYMTEESPRDLILYKGYLLIAEGDAGLEVVDISNPAMPVQVALFPAKGAGHVRVKGTLAFLTSNRDKVLVINISDPESISEVKEISVDYKIKGIYLKGDQLYIHSEKEIGIFNVSDPMQPVPVARHDVTGSISTIAVGEDNHIYLAAGSEGLRVVLTGNDAPSGNDIP
ncbi:MAG: hypothetical protein U0940_02955, partial [Nitrospirota bacterium]|nr:hypothetical protein [Nitrospirota bacterium]